jgi:hypothetical protein
VDGFHGLLQILLPDDEVESHFRRAEGTHLNVDAFFGYGCETSCRDPLAPEDPSPTMPTRATSRTLTSLL